MSLTAQQIAHFETFGYVVLRQLFSPEEMAAMSREFDASIKEDLQDQAFAGEKRLSVSPFIEKCPELWPFVEDDRIFEPMKQLLGPDFNWRGSGANLYVGNTEWHRDAADLELNFTRIKAVFNLDPVGRDSGCLRVIPGSHREPFHSRLRPLNYWRKVQVAGEGRIPQSDVDDFAREFNITEEEPLFGVEPSEVPAVALESQPGDVVFFNQYLYHASFGGRTGRRMFTMNFTVNPTTDEQIALLRKHIEIGIKGRKVMQHRAVSGLFDEAFLHSDRPRIQKMVSRLVELGIE
jgi:ectoine hydroxylase-related dioxygenase (phytanoyl-CoA dioxygenase family)